MLKSELIEAIAGDADISIATASKVIAALDKRVGIVLAAGGKVRLPFGQLIVKDRPAYRGRDPRAGKAITGAAKRLVRFKVSLPLAQRVNGER